MQRKNLIIAACAVMLAGCGGGSEAADQNKTDWNKFSLDNKATYNSAAKTLADKHSGLMITYPDFLSDSWQYADYDDQDDGKVMVSTPVTVNGQSVTMTEVLSTDGENVKGYYLAIGDQLYVDDGSCDDVMGKLGLPTK